MDKDLVQVRRYLKDRLQRNYTTFHGHQTERDNVKNVIQRTAEVGESNSLLLIGPRGSGKTTLINAVLTDLLGSRGFVQDTLIVHLDGNVHTDDRLALKAATVQMKLENATDGKVFGSFAENLAFLLACLKAGDKKSKSVIFIIEEFDLFCTHTNQTLLYNLFDISQSAQAPICVIGVTCRLDVIELLEKRVKSRFSHRQVFLFPDTDSVQGYMDTFHDLLFIPGDSEQKLLKDRVASLSTVDWGELTFHRNHFNPDKYKIDHHYKYLWNRHITALCNHAGVRKVLAALFEFDVSEAFLKSFLMRLFSQLNSATQPHITVAQVTQLAASLEVDNKIELLIGLSVLELCLVIAIKHHSEIYDRDAFNFEIIFGRFNKFAKVSQTMQGVERQVVLKAFEHLRNIELILPLTSTTGKVQKEFEMHKLALTYTQIQTAVQKYQALPTEISQWAQSSLT